MYKRILAPLAFVALVAVTYVGMRQTVIHAKADDKPLFARLIGPHTLCFFHSRVADVMKMPAIQAIHDKMPESKEQMEKGFREMFGMGYLDMETLTMYVDQPSMENGRPGEPRPPYMMARANKALDPAVVRATVGKNASSSQFGKYELFVGKDRGIALLDDRTVLLFNFDGRHDGAAAKQELILHFASLEAGNEVPKGLQDSVALAASGKHQVAGGFVISKEMGTFLQAQANNIPPMMSPFKPLAKLQSGTVTVDYTSGAESDMQVKLRGQFEDEGSAKAGMGAARFGIAAAKMGLSSLPNRNDADMKQMYDLMSKQLDSVKVDAEKSDVVVQYQMQTSAMMPALLAAIEKVRTAADRMLSASNMRQIIIAMHNYHNDFSKMPEAVTMKNGKPMHSWRVWLLPYMEHDNIFKQVKTDEPWDSPANKKLFESIPMPKFYAHPGKKDGDSKMTYYKVFFSKPNVNPSAGFSLGKPTTLGRMTVQDGTSNTVALIESGPPVLWYKPDDIEFDPKAQLPNMISPWKDKLVNVAFFDGSVRSFWLDGDEATWKGLITINGGEAVDPSKLEQKK